MLRLRPVRLLIAVLATWKVAFPVTEAIAPLKFQEYGVPKEHLAYMTSALMPMYILLPLVAARWTSGSNPLGLALAVYPARVVLGFLTLALASRTPAEIAGVGIPYGFYTLLVLLSGAGVVASQFMFVAQMAFFARVSDPAMGGTYMTLLNTLANLGGMWPPTVAMRLIDRFTCKGDTCAVQTDGFS